jgi:hypothetical protein
MNGAMTHHLRGCRALISSFPGHFQTDDALAAAVLEQYTYFSIVSTNIGLPSDENDAGDSGLYKDLPVSIRSNISHTRLHGFMFGASYGLFQAIPLITDLALERSQTVPRHADPVLYSKFLAIEQEILSWEPTMILPPTGTPRDDIQLWLQQSGLLYQSSLLVCLRAALHGPGIPTFDLQTQVDMRIEEFVEMLKYIPLNCAAWTQLPWAVLTIGSCMTRAEYRQVVSFALEHQQHKVLLWSRVLQLLMWLWEKMDEDLSYYGPFGLRRLMNERDIKLSLG